MCSMASFKEHCAFGFWKGSLIVEKGGGEVEKAMGQFGRISKLSDLPSKKVLSGYIKQAMKLNEDGVKSPTRSKPKEKTQGTGHPRRPGERLADQQRRHCDLREVQLKPPPRVRRLDQ